VSVTYVSALAILTITQTNWSELDATITSVDRPADAIPLDAFVPAGSRGADHPPVLFGGGARGRALDRLASLVRRFAADAIQGDFQHPDTP